MSLYVNAAQIGFKEVAGTILNGSFHLWLQANRPRSVGSGFEQIKRRRSIKRQWRKRRRRIQRRLRTAGKTVVLWISVDGVRGDYVDRGQSPFLKSLMEHGAYTRQLVPIFPSLTFPSHTSEATGVAAGVHGIVSNKWFDLAVGQEFNMPSDPKLLQAEPIWITASRQGVRTAVLDWPLSQGEDKLPADAARTAIFTERYVLELTDEQRLENVVAAYRKDSSDPNNTAPLQLLMGYVHDVDSTGHKYGPDAPETNKAIRDDDQVFEKIVGEVAKIFKQHMHPEQGDALYVLITTDHGMDNVKTLVNLQKLLGDIGADGTVRGVTSGSFANIYLDGVPGAPARGGCENDSGIFGRLFVRESLEARRFAGRLGFG